MALKSHSKFVNAEHVEKASFPISHWDGDVVSGIRTGEERSLQSGRQCVSPTEKANLQRPRVWYLKFCTMTSLDFWRNGSNKTSEALSTWKFNFFISQLGKNLLLAEFKNTKAREREKIESPSLPFSQSHNLWLMVNQTWQKTAFDVDQWLDLWFMSALDLWNCFSKILLENALPKKLIN